MADTKKKKSTHIDIASDDPVFSISVVSRLTHIPVWTLRVLDRQLIVCPKKTAGNTRLYSNNDVQKLAKVYYFMKVRKVNMGGLKVLCDLHEIGE